MQRSPKMAEIAKAAAEYQAVFQSLKDWGSCDIVGSQFYPTYGVFRFQCDTATTAAICQSLRDKGYTFTQQAVFPVYGPLDGSPGSAVLTVSLPRAPQPLT